MKDMNALVGQLTDIVSRILGLVLLVLLAGTIARAARLGLPWLPALGPADMAYVAGAWWLWRKAG